MGPLEPLEVFYFIFVKCVFVFIRRKIVFYNLSYVTTCVLCNYKMSRNYFLVA
jgi:hypothetical protein